MTTNGKKTIAEALSEGIRKLSVNKSISSPRLDCEILLGELLSLNRMELFLHSGDEISEEDYLRFSDLTDRRLMNEPVAYLTEKKEFMSLEFYVKPGILIPRPETEFLVEYIINRFRNRSAVTVLDLCTGSGAIAVSVAHYLEKSIVYAVDKYDVCIETTQKNCVLNRVDDCVTVIKADILDDISFSESFDCLVSNPPYIEKDVLSTLPLDVKGFEPMYALDGGSDGLIFYRRIITLAQQLIKPGGVLVLEIGFNQGESVSGLIKASNCFEHISITKDYAGLDRMITAQKRG